MFNYSEKIKEYRERKCLTQKELATLLGVSPICIVRWESNKVAPTMASKKKLMFLFEEAGMKLFEN